jgi:hypothetical protein
MASQWGPEDRKDAALLRSCVSLLLTNQFTSLSALLADTEAPALAQSKLDIVHLVLQVLVALSTYNEKQLSEALTQTWAVVDRAAPFKQKQNPACLRIEGQLIQATARLLGALCQLVQQKLVKGVWNIRKSWKVFEKVQESLKTYQGEHHPRLANWAEFGVGTFNLLVSCLPPTVLWIAEWAGFSANREGACIMLERCYQQEASFLAPFASLVLLIYDCSLAGFLGVADETNMRRAVQTQTWADTRFPKSVFFSWTQSRYLRCKGDFRGAYKVAQAGVTDCKELTTIKDLFYYQMGFCAVFRRAWKDALPALWPLVSPLTEADVNVHSTEEQYTVDITVTGDSFQAFYVYLLALSYGQLRKYQVAANLFRLVPQYAKIGLSRPIAKYAVTQATVMQQLYETASASTEDTKQVKSNKFDALELELALNVLEVMYCWSGLKQMQKTDLLGVQEMLLQIEPLVAASHDEANAARFALFSAALHNVLGEPEKALGFAALALSKAGSKVARRLGVDAFAHSEHAEAYWTLNDTKRAASSSKSALKVKGYALYSMSQFRLTAIERKFSLPKPAQLSEELLTVEVDDMD